MLLPAICSEMFAKWPDAYPIVKNKHYTYANLFGPRQLGLNNFRPI